VLLTSSFGPVSGVHTFNLTLARGLRRRGVDAKLLVTAPGATAEVDSGDAVVVRTEAAHSLDLGRRRDALVAFLQANSPCVWFPNGDIEHSVVASRLGPEVAIIGIAHSDERFHLDHVRRLGRYWNAIVAVSRHIADRVRRFPGVGPRVETVHYGVDVDETVQRAGLGRSGGLRLLYAGRLEERQKRVRLLAPVLRALRIRGIDATLTVIGSGPSEGRLRALLRKEIAANVVCMRGAVPHDEMAAVYAGHDVLLLLSRFEGLPLVLLEAMSHGCVPVLSAVRSGVREVVRHGTNGFLVPVRRPMKAVPILERLARRPELLETIAIAAHRTVRVDFSVERMVDRYLDLSNRVQRHAGPPGTFRRPDLPPQPPDHLRRDVVARIKRRLARLAGR